jgi:NADH dehydrogenase FAD-containing subunit
MHPYAVLYFIFWMGCHIVFGLIWRGMLQTIRFFTWAWASLLYTIPPLENRKRVVIVGGGFSGTVAAQELEDYFHVTIIDNKDYFEFTPSVLRTIVEPHHVRKLQVLHTHYLRTSTIIQKEVLKVEKDHVMLDDRNVHFDYLIINTGSTYQPPFKESRLIGSARGNTLRESYTSIKRAKKIVIIGGGLVGVEMAGEIASHFQGKEVTLVHSQSTVINRFPKKAIRYVEDFLRSRGVTILCNERVIAHKNQTFVTDAGKELEADLAFLCTGIQPNSGFLRENFGDCITPAGYVKTNDFLQLQGNVVYPNIFVAGDVADVKEEKLAQTAEKMAGVVASNILALERGGKAKTYASPPSRPVLISLGKYHGVFVFGNFSVTGPLPALLKEAVEWKTLMRY